MTDHVEVVRLMIEDRGLDAEVVALLTATLANTLEGGGEDCLPFFDSLDALTATPERAQATILTVISLLQPTLLRLAELRGFSPEQWLQRAALLYVHGVGS